MRLLSWNVAGPPTHGYGPIESLLRALSGSPLAALAERLLPGRWNRIEECARYIREGGHDLACLQEAWLRLDARRLRKGWPYHWRHRPEGRAFPFTGVWPYSGLLILACHHPSDSGTLRYSATSWNRTDWLARKGAAFTRWPFGWFCNTHLDAGRETEDKRARTRQIDELIPELLKRKPFVLAGDLNLDRGDRDDDAALERLLQDTDAECIEHEGFDYVLASPDLGVRRGDCPVVEEGLSDHPPLCVDIPSSDAG